MIGSGVSCGLAVSCHPCDEGKVIVQPGQAVDCCGNEIYVPCATELDINAMVRDLRYSRNGMDCGDPCAHDKAKAKANQATNRLDRFSDEREKSKVSNRYCLYINYCENPTDLVAPYTQDDACAVTCLPSRINEGYRFELRCPADEPPPPSIFDRIKCCIGDLGEANRKSFEFERSQSQIA
ncbi:MAG: hypothetical protein ACR2RL_02245, partial [Gammaproteobacteria bacterium]